MDNWLENKKLPYHLVSACGLVHRDALVLLIQNPKRGWELPGGTVEQLEFVLVIIRILSDADGIYLVILAADQAHRALDLKGALQAKSNTLLFAEQLKFVAIYAGVFGADKHVIGLRTGSLCPSDKFLQPGLVIGQVLGV